MGSDSRVRSEFFAGGSGYRTLLFSHWLSALSKPLTNVTITNPLWTIVSWLTGEHAPAPHAEQYAQEITGKRAPDPYDLRLAEAVLSAFLWDRDGCSSA
jgi:hypothetical protein